MASEVSLVGPTGQQQGGLDEYEFTVTRGAGQQKVYTETTRTLRRKIQRNSLELNWHVAESEWRRFVDDTDPLLVTLAQDSRKNSNRISEFQTMLNFIEGGDD